MRIDRCAVYIVKAKISDDAKPQVFVKQDRIRDFSI